MSPLLSCSGRIPLEDLITATPALTQSNSPQAARTLSTSMIENRLAICSANTMTCSKLFQLTHALYVGDPDPPPGQAAEERKTEHREAINTKNESTFYDIHRMFSVLPRWHLCLAPTGVSRTRLFSVDCGSYANSVHDQIRDSFVRLH
ncbi:ABC transporter G family member 39-like [Dorcoceras hygrometricum]|uniref:ABC transporter G family member 39-like n=1 Tax=Dorcoceras hygrometricum TaxID=472368 RepID=A0A2Z7CUM7_9LAMI|nr:ABC transporter G family member 39-like [Dorcoceras hygrometricum]